MAHKIVLLLSLLSICSFCRCEDRIKEENFLKFKYNNIQYTDYSAWFRISDKKEYIIGSSKVELNKIFGIIISIEMEVNKTYPIFNSTFKKIIPDIWVRFDGDSSIKSTYDNTEKIGEITITEKTSSRLSGIFNCKLEDGEITNGEFSVIRNTVTEF